MLNYTKILWTISILFIDLPPSRIDLNAVKFLSFFCYDSTMEFEPRSFDCKADAPIIHYTNAQEKFKDLRMLKMLIFCIAYLQNRNSFMHISIYLDGFCKKSTMLNKILIRILYVLLKIRKINPVFTT